MAQDPMKHRNTSRVSMAILLGAGGGFSFGVVLGIPIVGIGLGAFWGVVCVALHSHLYQHEIDST